MWNFNREELEALKIANELRFNLSKVVIKITHLLRSVGTSQTNIFPSFPLYSLVTC